MIRLKIRWALSVAADVPIQTRNVDIWFIIFVERSFIGACKKHLDMQVVSINKCLGLEACYALSH
jgi:hypothetical protein